MPINYSRRLAGKHRSKDANIQLGLILAFVAGATNAGGFLAVHQYTSHMTGIVSSMADDIALGTWEIALTGIGAMMAFIAGAACSAAMVNYSRHRQLHSEYAAPLMLEAGLLLCFGLLGARLSVINGVFVPVTVMLLCFIMGLQNAVITKLSNAEIRTTHVTGVVTDIGIELGKLFYRRVAGQLPEGQGQPVSSGKRLMILTGLVTCFFTGGLIGAIGFKHLGYIATMPLALILMALVAVPVSDDVAAWWHRPRQ